MQAEVDVEDILKEVERFRILCVGKSGAGKSSLVNRVFRLGRVKPTVEHWTPGKVDIEEEFTENKLFVLHDSRGFEPGNEESFNTVDSFVRKRRKPTLPLKEQLHAVWHCIELPTSGQRLFETGDEKVLQLVHDTKTPLVVVFTKYDRLLVSKKDEFGESLGSEKAKEVYDDCVQSLKNILSKLKLPITELLYVKVSGRTGFEATIESLVTMTRDLVSSQLKVMWEIAQRASLRVTIEGCVNNSLRGIRFEGFKLDDCLAKVYQNIVPYWNFVDNEKTLNSKGFKDLMLCLVQDFQNLQNLDGPYSTTLTPNFTEWLSKTDLNDELAAQHVLMAYAADLITVLKSLFEKVTQPSSEEAPKVTRQALTDVYQTHKTSAIRRDIYRRISAQFLNRTGDLSSLLKFFHRLLLHSLGFDPVPPPDSGNTGRVTSSSTGLVVASSSRPRPTEIATPSRVAQVAQPPPSSTVIPPKSLEVPAPEPSPNVWSRFIGCLTSPC